MDKKELGKKIEKYIALENWNRARYYINKGLSKYPKDHWLLTRLALTHYEQRNYKIALRIGEQALKLAPKCPLVLWDHAGTLYMSGDFSRALNIYNKLVRRGVESLAYGECGEGVRWAKSLVNDCFYRMALCYRKSGNRSKAIELYRRHLKSRAPGIPSIYSLKEVKQEFREYLK